MNFKEMALLLQNYQVRKGIRDKYITPFPLKPINYTSIGRSLVNVQPLPPGAPGFYGQLDTDVLGIFKMIIQGSRRDCILKIIPEFDYQNPKKNSRFLVEFTREFRLDDKNYVTQFKLAFGAESEGIKGDVGILIVNNMLLTGFDAPIEQVMYLDQVIRAHNLLQAVARVNRVAGEEKEKGFIVDYVGVGHHLKEAIDNFEEREKNEILDCFENEQDELNALVSAHKKIYEFIKKQGVKNLNDYDTFYDLFYDEDIRFEFIVPPRGFAGARS